MMYLGSLGQMVAIKCPTVQRVATAARYSFSTTLGGVVKAQAGEVGRRTWDISLGQLSTPSDVGTLMDFATGVWGPGPYWFVPADAPVVNVLTPAAAACGPQEVEFHEGSEFLGSPPLDLGEHGVAARSLWKTSRGSVVFRSPVPVRPGHPVTGSAWVSGAGRIRLVFVDSTGSEVSNAESSLPSDVVDRVSVTAKAPDTSAAVKLVFTDGVTQAARPTITWTDQAFEWGDGQGCSKAVVLDASRDVVKAWNDPRTGRWSDVSFSVREVG